MKDSRPPNSVKECIEELVMRIETYDGDEEMIRTELVDYLKPKDYVGIR